MQSKAPDPRMATGTCLKRGSLGDVRLVRSGDETHIVRELNASRRGCRPLARYLARREARALVRLENIDGVPALIAIEPDRLVRTAFSGRPMHESSPPSRDYFRRALHLLRRLHAAGVTHNDLAKEANWICRPEQQPAIVDFQLAVCFHRHGRMFRLLAREDLRHLLKHKARYQPDAISSRQRQMLERPSLPSRLLRSWFKPAYLFLTRRLLGWPERAGAAERERQPADERRPG